LKIDCEFSNFQSLFRIKKRNEEQLHAKIALHMSKEMFAHNVRERAAKERRDRDKKVN
jgi:hypothetical protein